VNISFYGKEKTTPKTRKIKSTKFFLFFVFQQFRAFVIILYFTLKGSANGKIA